MTYALKPNDLDGDVEGVVPPSVVASPVAGLMWPGGLDTIQTRR